MSLPCPPIPPGGREVAGDAASKRAIPDRSCYRDCRYLPAAPPNFSLVDGAEADLDSCYIPPSTSLHVLAGLVRSLCVGRFSLMQIGAEAWLLGIWISLRLRRPRYCERENRAERGLRRRGCSAKRLLLLARLTSLARLALYASSTARSAGIGRELFRTPLAPSPARSLLLDRPRLEARREGNRALC